MHLLFVACLFCVVLSILGNANCLSCVSPGGCQSCNAGFVFSNGNCTSCPEGSYSAAGTNNCVTCSPGTYTAEPGAPCLPCTAGSTLIDDSCTKCAAGSFDDDLNIATDCVGCPLGTYSAIGATRCPICPLGTFTNAPGRASCTSCLCLILFGLR